jgi:TIR domain
MPERKAAIINVSKGLLNVSLTAIAAIGGATGNVWLAGVMAIPGALAASGTLKPLLEKKQEEHLEIPIPKWWTEEPQSQSWQDVCSSIESRLPEITRGVEEQLSKETSYPSSSVIKSIFVEQVARHLSPWEVNLQYRVMVAGYVTPLLLEKSATVLNTVVASTREDALAKWLTQIANTLDVIQKATISPASIAATVTAVSAIEAGEIVHRTQSSATISEEEKQSSIIEQKRQIDAYDIYICYDEIDETEVMTIGEKLIAKGILPWFDILGVKPGGLEEEQEEEQIQKIPAAAVFIGQHKIVDKQALQMYSFINQFIERKIPVIPVILTNVSKDLKLPPYLGNFGKVDFRRSIPEPMGQLVWGITGVRP